jgi:exodeoxyribonuclease-3
MVGENPDIVCIQETKAQIDQLGDPIFSPDGYTAITMMRRKKAIAERQFTAR